MKQYRCILGHSSRVDNNPTKRGRALRANAHQNPRRARAMPKLKAELLSSIVV